MASTFNARNAATYEQTMGRWSRRLAPGFLAFAGIAPQERVIEVGCGTGSLTRVLATTEVATVAAIDAAAVYVDSLRASLHDPRFDIRVADACALPFETAQFDRALCQLVLQFIPTPDVALAEMRRVVRPGGTVAAAVWASGGGMPHQRLFLDTAALLDPVADRLRADSFSRPGTSRGELDAAFRAAGLAEVEESFVTIWMEFADFEDYWGPFIGGEGTLGRYAAGLPPEAAETLRGHLRTGFLAGRPDGPRAFACTALVCRGHVR